MLASGEEGPKFRSSAPMTKSHLSLDPHAGLAEIEMASENPCDH